MPISNYMRALREQVGTRLILCPGVAAVIHDDQGRLLAQKRAEDGTWSLPAGAVDPGETPAQAVVREVWEETGLKVVPERVLGVFGGSDGFRFTYPNGDVSEYLVVLFHCRIVGGVLGCLDGESLALRFFHPQEIPPMRASYPRDLLTAPGIRAPHFDWNAAWLDDLAK